MLLLVAMPWLAMQERPAFTTAFTADTAEPEPEAPTPSATGSLDYSKTDEILNKQKLTANAIYDRADKHLDPAADKTIELSHSVGKQVRQELAAVNGYQESMKTFRQRLKSLHDTEAGEIKEDMERATAPRIRDKNRPASAFSVPHTEDSSAFVVPHTEDSSYEVSSALPWSSDSPLTGGSASSLAETKQASGPGDEDSEADDSVADEAQSHEGRLEEAATQQEIASEEHAAENSMPLALSYPDYNRMGELYIKRFDDLHHKVTTHLDQLAHNADMKSLKYAYGLDGIRHAVRNLKNSTQEGYREHMRKTFKDQVQSFQQKVVDDKDAMYTEAHTKEQFPAGFWHDNMNKNVLYPPGAADHEASQPASAAEAPEWAKNAALATGKTPEEVIQRLQDSLLQVQSSPAGQPQQGSHKDVLKAEKEPTIPYNHFKAYGKALEESGQRIGHAFDKLTSKLPDMQQKSEEYKHKNFLLHKGVEELKDKVTPQFAKKVQGEKKSEIESINMLDLSRIFTPRHKQVLKEATQDDRNLIEGKFKDRPKVDFGKNPYDDMSNQQWNADT